MHFVGTNTGYEHVDSIVEWMKEMQGKDGGKVKSAISTKYPRRFKLSIPAGDTGKPGLTGPCNLPTNLRSLVMQSNHT